MINYIYIYNIYIGRRKSNTQHHYKKFSNLHVINNTTFDMTIIQET
jgi:hypothetical protein